MGSDNFNLASILRDHAASRPDHPALEMSGLVLSYHQVWQRVAELAAALGDQGVNAGDRVALALKEHPDHLLLHFAIAGLGAVLLPVDHRWSTAEKLGVCSAMNARLLVIEPDGEALEGLPAWRLQAGAELPGATLDPVPAGDRPWLISLSSGTTGRPKGALVTHREMYERFINQWVTLGFNATDRFLGVTPLYFGAGRSFGMCFLSAGASVILDPPPHQPQDLVASINNSRASVVFLVPTLMRRLLPMAADQQPLLPGLRRLVSSGEPLYPEEAAEIQQKLNRNLIAYYASSEGGGISILQPEEFDTYSDTVGRPGFRLRVEIVDADDQPLGIGETGRLRYAGPGVARRFLDEDGQETESGGWFYPGDLAAIDERGFVQLRGREKDVIIRGGVNVYPAEIEKLLSSRDDVRESAVVGRSSKERGEEIIAYVEADADALTERELLDFCRQRLAPYKVPSQIHVLASLPRAGSGKIDKKALGAGTA